MSRRDQVFQALNSVQNHIYDFIDTHPAFQQQQQHQQQQQQYSHLQQHAASSSSSSAIRRSDTVATLPTYGRQRESSDEPIPNEVLYAPPGQAQLAADQLPTSRMARGDARDARRAAAALRNEQLKTGQLKKKHTFASSNGRILMEFHSTPQKTLTYIGGTAERGRGAMKGKVIVHAQEGDRISAIRLKLKAIIRVMVPKAGTPQMPFQLDHADPSRESCTEKEILLLQLESRLYSTPSTGLPAGSTSHDPTLMNPGSYEFPFSIEIPSQTGKGQLLPPSFILSPLKAQNNTVVRTGPFSLPLPNLSSEWASVKWYAKLTVERPGLFRANDRIFAPFVYLPPPPKVNNIDNMLNGRARLAMEVDNALRRFHAANYAGQISLEHFIEPVSGWDEIHLPYGIAWRKGLKQAPSFANEKSNETTPGLFSRLLFGSQVDGPSAPTKESFSLSIPKNPHVFPLRSGIPFVLHRSVQWKGQVPLDTQALSRVPHVILLQRTNVFGRAKGPMAGTAVRFVAESRQTPDTRPAASWSYEPKGYGKSQLNRRGESWLGILDLPPMCMPCFDTPVLTLDYYLSVRTGAGQAQEVLHTEPVVICCPPSRPAPSTRTAPTVGRTPTSRPSARASTGSATAAPRPSGRRPIVPDEELSSGRVAGPSSGHVPRASSSRPLPSTNNAIASSSSLARPRPAAQASISPAVNEKRTVPEQFHQQVSLPPSRTSSPAPVSRPAAGSSVPPRPPLTSAVSSRAPSENGTNEDDDPDDPGQWQFHEDELTDLPPSYFEATAADHDD